MVEEVFERGDEELTGSIESCLGAVAILAFMSLNRLKVHQNQHLEVF